MRQRSEPRLDFFQLGSIVCSPSSLFDGLVDAGEETMLIKWLFDEIERSQLDRSHCHIDIAVTSDQVDWRHEASSIELAHELNAGNARHAHIRSDAVESLRAIHCRQGTLRRR